MRRAILCCLALTGGLLGPGCGQRASQPPENSAAPAENSAAPAENSAASAEKSAASADTPRPRDAGSSDASPSNALPWPIPATTRQIVIGVAGSWESTTITLSLHQRDPGGAWQRMGAPWPAAVGHAGMAWGRGLHGHGAPQGQPGPKKREGDGKAPAGAFAISRAYGYAKSARTRMPYAHLTDAWRCVNDSRSARYNQVFDSTGMQRDWSTAEYMRRHDDLYARVIEIAHNADAAPQGGSCIFFHIWSDPNAPTLGCTAMASEPIESLLAALDPAARPVYVLLPRDRYIELAASWNLPAPAATDASP